MKMRLAIPVAAALLLTPAVWAQSASPGGANKVGVIDVQAAVAGTAEGKQALAELQSQFSPRQTELANLQKQIEDDQTRLRTGQTTLSDDEKGRLTREYDLLTRSYQRKSQDAQDDFNEAQQELLNRIGRKMMDVLDKYSKDNGYSVILDTSSQQTPVLYAANQVNVTQDIIRLYDQSYPVKTSTGSTTPSKPSVPRASTTPKQ
jgi:outer membrane protein